MFLRSDEPRIWSTTLECSVGSCTIGATASVPTINVSTSGPIPCPIIDALFTSTPNTTPSYTHGPSNHPILDVDMTPFLGIVLRST